MQPLNRLGFVLGISATILLGACSSTPVDPNINQASAPAANPGAQATATTAAPVAKAVLAPHTDPAHVLFQQRRVYFDFDQSVVKAEYTPLLEMHGKYLVANPQLALAVEGSTDELGGAEYNLALGQKRAMAVVSVLKIYGARDAQLEAVSFGEEKPLDAGHGEAAYKANRRAELRYHTR
jgi:peptidoglycan-associated lipoprotein